MSARQTRSEYTPDFPLGARVQVVRGVGPTTSILTATVIRALPNPSQRPENQWYDVKFDEGRLGRFNTCFLKSMNN